MTTGGGGEEFLSARINFEIPQEAMGQLREFNTELERVRVNSESAARGVDSFMRYIELMNAAQERTIQTSRNLAANLERIMQIQERAGQSDAGTAVPQQYTAPWAAGSEGMGGRHRDITSAPTTVPAVGGNSAEFDRLMNTDPRAYLNARAAWGGGSGGGGGGGGQAMPSVSISDASLERLARTLDSRDRQHEEQQSKTSPDHPSAQPSGTGRGGGRPAPRQQAEKPPWESWRDRAAQWTGTAGSVAGGLGMGGSFSGVFGMAGRALQGWGARQSREDPSVGTGPGSTVPRRPRPTSTGAGPPSVPTGGETGEGGPENPASGGTGEDEGAGGLSLGSAAGWGGAALTAGVGIFGAGQKVGQQVQQYRALGQVRGGGFGEGFGYEMQARMMAMNPFITTEQSRQIIQSALTQGYTGKEFDTVTDFMAHNLKEMNMSASESMKTLQEAAHNSNQSVQGIAENLRFSMDTMKNLSKEGYNTLPARQQAFEAVAGTATRLGGDVSQSSRLGLVAGQMFNDEPGMQDMGQRLLNGAMNSDSFAYMAQSFGGANIPGASMGDPDTLMMQLKDTGKLDATTMRVVKQIATWSHGNVRIFRRMMQRMMGVQLDPGEARKLMQDAMAVDTGADNDPIKSGRQVDRQMGQEREQRQTAAGQRALGGAFAPGAGGGAFGGIDRPGMGPVSPGMAQRWAAGHGITGDAPGSELEKQLLQDFNGHSIEIGSGDKWSPIDITNQNQINDLKSGKLRVRQRGDQGTGSKLSELPGMGSITGTGAGRDGGGAKGDGVQGHLQITVHPANMRGVLNIPEFIPLTANEQAANAGFGNARKNNPPPGDTITSRGARGG